MAWVIKPVWALLPQRTTRLLRLPRRRLTAMRRLTATHRPRCPHPPPRRPPRPWASLRLRRCTRMPPLLVLPPAPLLMVELPVPLLMVVHPHLTLVALPAPLPMVGHQHPTPAPLHMAAHQHSTLGLEGHRHLILVRQGRPLTAHPPLSLTLLRTKGRPVRPTPAMVPCPRSTQVSSRTAGPRSSSSTTEVSPNSRHRPRGSTACLRPSTALPSPSTAHHRLSMAWHRPAATPSRPRRVAREVSCRRLALRAHRPPLTTRSGVRERRPQLRLAWASQPLSPRWTRSGTCSLQTVQRAPLCHTDTDVLLRHIGGELVYWKGCVVLRVMTQG
mmetsp:Transcript_9175/g.16099  ORF Transcript_9175/g.16099 Transcript_9175/m.16099 type:complete len:330 (+) Transcript_9175:1015-2004(+)